MHQHRDHGERTALTLLTPAIDGLLPGRPLPLVDADTMPFFAAAARGELLVQRCRDTGRYQHYPRPCSIYTGGEVEWLAASGGGTIYSFSVVRQNSIDPVFGAIVPYVLALIDLEEGCRMMGNITGCDPDAVAIGMAVQVYFACVDEAAETYLPFWKPTA